MNHYAREVGLRDSYFDSPHGLANHRNVSTALDVAKVSAECLNDPRFLEIVSTKTFRVGITEENKNKNEYFWENTHKMVD